MKVRPREAARVLLDLSIHILRGFCCQNPVRVSVNGGHGGGPSRHGDCCKLAHVAPGMRIVGVLELREPREEGLNSVCSGV